MYLATDRRSYKRHCRDVLLYRLIMHTDGYIRTSGQFFDDSPPYILLVKAQLIHEDKQAWKENGKILILASSADGRISLLEVAE